MMISFSVSFNLSGLVLFGLEFPSRAIEVGLVSIPNFPGNPVTNSSSFFFHFRSINLPHELLR